MGRCVCFGRKSFVIAYVWRQAVFRSAPFPVFGLVSRLFFPYRSLRVCAFSWYRFYPTVSSSGSAFPGVQIPRMARIPRSREVPHPVGRRRFYLGNAGHRPAALVGVSFLQWSCVGIQVSSTFGVRRRSFAHFAYSDLWGSEFPKSPPTGVEAIPRLKFPQFANSMAVTYAI